MVTPNVKVSYVGAWPVKIPYVGAPYVKIPYVLGPWQKVSLEKKKKSMKIDKTLKTHLKMKQVEKTSILALKRNVFSTRVNLALRFKARIGVFSTFCFIFKWFFIVLSIFIDFFFFFLN